MEKWKKLTVTGLAAFTLAACGTDTPTTEEPGTETTTPADSSSEVMSSESSPGTNDTVDVITMTEALDIYWAEYPDAQIETIDFDDDYFNDWTYEITGVSENREYEVEISATTEEILETEEDDADNDDNEYLNFDTIIDAEEAIEIARKEVDSQATLEGWTLDRDDNRSEYEVEFEGTDDRDVTIDAETGDVIEVDN